MRNIKIEEWKLYNLELVRDQYETTSYRFLFKASWGDEDVESAFIATCEVDEISKTRTWEYTFHYGKESTIKDLYLLGILFGNNKFSLLKDSCSKLVAKLECLDIEDPPF